MATMMTGGGAMPWPSMPTPGRPAPQGRALAAREIEPTRERLTVAERTITTICDRHAADRVNAADIEHTAGQLADYGRSVLMTVDQVLAELSRIDGLDTKLYTADGIAHTRTEAIGPLAALQLSQLRRWLDDFDAKVQRLASPPLYPTDVEALVRSELEQIMSGADFDPRNLLDVARDTRYATTLAGPFGRALAMRWPNFGPAIVESARSTLLDAGDERMTVARDLSDATAALVEGLAMASWIATTVSVSEGVELASAL
jgi:hypothetical protein